MGYSPATFKRRLQRGRELLRLRLARRGVALSTALLIAGLADGAAEAGGTALLLGPTVRAAVLFAAGQGVAVGNVPSGAAALAQGVLQTLSLTKTKVVMIAVLMLALTVAGGALTRQFLVTPETERQTADESRAADRPDAKEVEQVRLDRHGDPLPTGALARLGTTRMRHTEHINGLLVAPDGKHVASGGMDNTVRLWDLATGKLVRSLKHPRGILVRPHPVSFAPDGKTLISSTTNQLWLWDVRTGEQLRELKLKLEPNQRVFSLTISSDGKKAASWEGDAIVRLWDVASGNLLRVLHGQGRGMRPLSFSSDNKTLAALADDDKVVRLWDVSSGKLLHKLEHPFMIATVSFAPDGKTLASAGNGSRPSREPEGNPNAVQLWDVATGKPLHTLEGHQQVITSLSFSPNGKVLASGSWDRTIRLWDVTAGKQLRKLKCPAAYLSLSFTPDGEVLASAGSGPAVRLWDVARGAELHRSGEAHTGQVCSISFAPDGRTLGTAAAMGEGDDTVRLWDAAAGKPLRKLEHPGRAHAVVFAPDGKMLASGGAGVVRLWDAATGKLRRQLEAPGGSPLAFSPAGAPGVPLLAAGSNGEMGQSYRGTLRLWDVATGTQQRALEHPSLTTSVAFSPDGKTLAVGTVAATLHLWDTATGQELLQLDKMNEQWGALGSLSFTPDGKTLAVASVDRKIHLLETATGREVGTLTGHSHQVLTVAFSPSGRLLASGSMDQTVRLWEVNAGLASECRQFRGHDAWVASVAFSPDGRRLASGSHDSTALVWDVTGLAAGPAREVPLTPAELTACWQSLASTDAARAYQARRTLAAAPDQAVPFLAGQLREQIRKRPDPQQVAHLLADLDSEKFRARSRAAKELEKWGEAVEPALHQALKGDPSLETRRCIQQLLEGMHPQGGSPKLLLRWLRVVDVLEWIDNQAAREFLKKLAAAPPREQVGQETKAALRRLREGVVGQ
jgi:WD40 repeat protein